MQTWQMQEARVRLVKRSVPALDSLDAATALHHAFSLVTRNETDFRLPELDVIDLRPR